MFLGSVKKPANPEETHMDMGGTCKADSKPISGSYHGPWSCETATLRLLTLMFWMCQYDGVNVLVNCSLKGLFASQFVYSFCFLTAQYSQAWYLLLLHQGLPSRRKSESGKVSILLRNWEFCVFVPHNTCTFYCCRMCKRTCQSPDLISPPVHCTVTRK